MQAGWTNLIETVKSTPPVWRPGWRSVPGWVLALLMWIALTMLLVAVFGG